MIKRSAENKEGAEMANDNRVEGGASYSVIKEVPCVVVTSESRPKGRDGTVQKSSAAWGFDLSEGKSSESQNSLKADSWF